MSNSFEKIVAYLPQVLDEVAAMASVTGVIPNGLVTGQVEAAGIQGEYRVLKIAYDSGLQDYKRNTGFETGATTTTWETLAAAYDRAKSFMVDAVDDEQAGKIATRLLSDFVRTKVVPELDAYRLATYAKKAGTAITQASYTKSTALAAVETAMAALFDAEIDPTGAILFCTSTFKGLLEQAVGDNRLDQGTVINHKVSVYNGVNIVPVPTNRFYSEITLNPAGGYAKGESAVGINFMLVKPEAVVQLIQHQGIRSFAPSVNQTADAYKLDYRVFGDAWVLDNKAMGIYVSKASA